MSKAPQREIELYVTTDGKIPFAEWLSNLKDKRAKDEVKRRLDRVIDGNFGDHHALPGTDGVSELRITYGPAYRIYYGETATTIVVLLCGGDKGSQAKDIKKAKGYWQDYLASLTVDEENYESNEETSDRGDNKDVSEEIDPI
jgi:putative addiction module killer protein